MAIFSEVVSNGVRIGVSNFLHFVARVVMHTKRDSEFPSWIRRGGCAINKCGEASLAGADGVVDQCCEATL